MYLEVQALLKAAGHEANSWQQALFRTSKASIAGLASLSVVLVTSPIPSHPSTQLIDALAALRRRGDGVKFSWEVAESGMRTMQRAMETPQKQLKTI